MSQLNRRTYAPAWLGMTALLLAACGQRNGDAGFAFVEATIDDVQMALRSGQLSCTDVVSGYLERIGHYDQASGLNAVILTNPAAMDTARDIDERLAAGNTLGDLFCIPVLLKDNFDTADMPTSGGSIALKDSVPPDDAFMVRKLREADAIIIAKTNMAEWAFSPRQTVSSSYGTTANAYALDRVPAGSSGGTASATAASFGVIGMGSDTGNSIRGPSSHLALFGIRSTIGLTSRSPRESMLASLCSRASRAVVTSQHSAQRTPLTRLAAIASPLPEPPSTMPRSQSPRDTASAAGRM